MDSQDWEPPTEAEMKIIVARREHTDKISKLMSSYLLKGYKMLGIVCSVCDTILLQDRQGTNYCVACSELDTDKDNPVTNQSAARSMAREIKLAARGGTQTDTKPRGTVLAKSTRLVSASQVQAGSVIGNGHLNPHTVLEDDGPHSLSMSKIDVHSWPTDPESRQGDHGATSQTEQSMNFEQINSDCAYNSGFFTLSDGGLSPIPCTKKHSGEARQKTNKASLSPHLSSVCISTLCEKIEWASQELKNAASVDYSIQLCQLIKIAAEAVTSVRDARI